MSTGTMTVRALRLLSRVVTDAILPLGVAYITVSFLGDASRIDTTELRANSLLMNTHPVFRNIFDSDVFASSVGSSAALLLVAMSGALLVAVPAGIAYGWSSRRSVKTVIWSASTFAASLPTFFWAVALELLFIGMYLRFGFRPFPTAGFGLDEHLVLPSIALGLRPAAYIFRLTATAVDEISHTDYVRTAIAKGLSTSVVLGRHVLPNASPTIAAAVVLATRGALSGLVIVDFVYIWGGAGLTFVQALGFRRLDLATELALSFAVASVVLALAADAAKARVRASA